ncbi:MAG: DUF3575 domain-containing protein [Bacteroidetes bacterium]|jgi:hypothetical protein|nr:DUF3575 domain-containing protein [Bacteroidota bacterium]
MNLSKKSNNRKLFSTIVTLLFLQFYFGQEQVAPQNKTLIKGNVLLAPIGLINLGVEKQIAPKFTLQAEVFVSPWKSFAGKYAQAYMGGIDGRYYFREAMDGWYVGGNISFMYYKLQKWNYWNDNIFQLDKDTKPYIKNNLYQEGFAMVFGVVGGYQWKLSDRWKMDIYAGVGSSQGFYKGYDRISGDRYDGDENWNKSGEIIPYKGGVMLSYQLK